MRGAWIPAALALAIPRVALACPACARDTNRLSTKLIVAAMIALPYAIVGLVVRTIRRGDDKIKETP